jgi:mannose-6-phosphate isomerase-like protein (cupin superfamily)
VRLSPPPGGTKFRYFILPPEDPHTPREEIERGVAARFAAYGESHARVDTTRHPAMHKTHSLDYIILLSGEVTLLLDEDEVPVRPFDVVVQRGTNHAWVNTGPEPALFAGVLIDAEFDD